MKRSSDRIFTTHAGALPWEKPILPGQIGYEAKLKEDVRGIVARQRDTGLDVINEGEFTKGGDWLSFMDGRLGGCEPREDIDGKYFSTLGKDREEFADFYRYAGEKGTLFYAESNHIVATRLTWFCTAPITYVGQEEMQREIDLLKATAGTEDVFLTTTAPASLEPYYRNEYYDSQDDFVFGMAEALKTEYKMIADAGFILQVDDAWLPATWDRTGIQMGLEKYRDWCMVRIEALNRALDGIPEEQIRYHLCWGSWHGPHAHDIELEKIVDIMLAVNAGAYLIEAANARHEHEYIVWDDVKLPDGKILIPGVVAHATDLIEHPELVSQRIQRFAERVGRENVIAGTDCGFGGRSHPQIAWAKLKALTEGAELASKALGY
ncbi:MAG: hypothetical protein VW169_09930 [Rhodospirillaceae bacterium]|jgi:5-methyltetrahydropteroyltriglutamate--homocysteine methyltransferase